MGARHGSSAGSKKVLGRAPVRQLGQMVRGGAGRIGVDERGEGIEKSGAELVLRLGAEQSEPIQLEAVQLKIGRIVG